MKTLYIANWKMQRSFTQECSLAQEYCALAPAIQQKDAQLVLCPSFPSLDPIHTRIARYSSLKLGAQNCSRYPAGPYAGQVSAQSLAEVGCSYCIVGHSERRDFETSNQIAEKVRQLITNKIIPVVCTGETQDQYKNNETLNIIEGQLKPVLETIEQYNSSAQLFCIAYEPVWSIGTGRLPNQDHLTRVFSFIQSVCTQNALHIKPMLLYGGSVNEENLVSLTSNPLIQGFLIGGASLDIQKLKKIVSL